MSDAAATLVDANVLLDVMTRDVAWLDWSRSALRLASDAGPLVINPIIYAEVSVRYSSRETLDTLLEGEDLLRSPLPWNAAFLAGKLFVEYRRRGGPRRSPLPDFFIGAHAAVAGMRLLTRDARRYRSYLPGLELIAPT